MELDRRQQSAMDLSSAVIRRAQRAERYIVLVAVGALASAAAWLHFHEGETSRPPRQTGVAPAPMTHVWTSATSGGIEEVPSSRPAFSASDLEAALAEVAASEREAALSDGLSRLMAVDAHAAVEFAERETDPYLREVSLRTVAQLWSREDAGAVIAWAESIVDTKERNRVIERVALELALSDPRRALALLERERTDETFDPAIAGILQQWAEQDFAAALAWAEAQPAGKQRDLLMTRLVFVRANEHPADAARLADRVFTNDTARQDALASIARDWGARDREAAREWARTLDLSSRRRIDSELSLLDVQFPTQSSF